MEKLLIIDSHSLMNRAFYAIPPLTNSEGIHTNAVYGYTNMILKLKEELKADYMVATFDRKAPTFRHEEYKEYKAGRKKMPEELSEQFPLVKEMLKLLAIDIFEIDGFEADDLIGTLAVYAEQKGIEVYIVTGDRDALQLASDHIKVILTKKGITEKEIYDKQRMIEEYGVTPTQFIDVKGLMGDASDNIPGVPGIGEKTAYKLIQQYGSVENVLMNVDNISGKKIKENLEQYREQAVFSKKLATIITNVPIEIDLESIKSKENFDLHGLRQLFLRLQFKSLLEKLPADEERKEETPLQVEEVHSIEALKKCCQSLEGEVFINFGVVNSNVYSKICVEKIFLFCKGQGYIIFLKDVMEMQVEETISILKNILENKEFVKIGYDIKSPMIALDKLGISLSSFNFDTKIAAYLINSSTGNYELKDLIGEYLHKEVSGEGDILKMKETSLLNELYPVLKKEIEAAGMEELFYNVEQPLISVLAFMEKEGFYVDKQKLEALGEKFKVEIEKVQSEIYDLAEENFNISSPKQLGKILFEKLDLPVIKKTKTGYSTNAEVLEELSDKHPIIDKISYYRQLTKLHSTYIEGLKAVIDEDGKIHSSLNQTVTTTGRLSSTEPNLQNIPIKYEMGREIRKVFVPRSEGHVILSADYSQIELRVLAEIAKDENLLDAFIHHSDIHTKTASEVFKVPIEEVTPLMRGRAKAVNFGIVYGMGDFSLAKDLKITKKEAKSYIDTYFERYPGVKRYMTDIVQHAKEKGYVTTILNRRRYIPEITNSNKIVQSLGERLAMNTPIQGSAADIIKLAMVNVYFALSERGLKSKLILQVHDELIIDVDKEEIEEVKTIVKNEMEKVLSLKVPLEVDINIGENWYTAK